MTTTLTATITCTEQDAVYQEWKNAERATDAAFIAWDNAFFSFPQNKAEIKRLSEIHDRAWKRLQRAFKAQIRAGLKSPAPMDPCCACRQPSADLRSIPDAIIDSVAEFEGWENLPDGECGGYCEDCLNEWEQKYSATRGQHWSYGGAR
jgi:hypothetical protein